MIPATTVITQTSTIGASKTYRLDKDNKRVMGFLNGQEAMEQAVELLLTTERYAYEIYDWSYGSQLHTLMGLPLWEAEMKAEEEIREALLVDDRVKEVKDFSLAANKDSLLVSFTVVTAKGVLEQNWEVGKVGIKIL